MISPKLESCFWPVANNPGSYSNSPTFGALRSLWCAQANSAGRLEAECFTAKFHALPLSGQVTNRKLCQDRPAPGPLSLGVAPPANYFIFSTKLSCVFSSVYPEAKWSNSIRQNWLLEFWILSTLILWNLERRLFCPQHSHRHTRMKDTCLPFLLRREGRQVQGGFPLPTILTQYLPIQSHQRPMNYQTETAALTPTVNTRHMLSAKFHKL